MQAPDLISQSAHVVFELFVAIALCTLMATAVHGLTRPRRTGSADKSTVSDVTDGALEAWADTELYAVWRATKSEFARATEAEQAVTAARARQLLLAEIERRYPTQTKAWLSSAAAVTGEPPEFLRTT